MASSAYVCKLFSLASHRIFPVVFVIEFQTSFKVDGKIKSSPFFSFADEHEVDVIGYGGGSDDDHSSIISLQSAAGAAADRYLAASLTPGNFLDSSAE